MHAQEEHSPPDGIKKAKSKKRHKYKHGIFLIQEKKETSWWNPWRPVLVFKNPNKEIRTKEDQGKPWRIKKIDGDNSQKHKYVLHIVYFIHGFYLQTR